MEGIIWYRLLGNHPAASGKRWMMAFPGETVRLSSILADVVKEHHINESIYRLDVQFVRSSVSNSGPHDVPVQEMISISKNDILQNYDRIDITVSKKNFVEEMKGKQQHAGLHSHLDQTYAEAGLESSASLIAASPTIISCNTSSSEGRARGDLHFDFQRVRVLMTKTFPLFPGKTCKESTNNAFSQRQCVLCNFGLRPSFFVFPCCNYTVCADCKEAAESMSSSAECVVCGRRIMRGGCSELGGHQRVKREESFHSTITKHEEEERNKNTSTHTSVRSDNKNSCDRSNKELAPPIAERSVALDSFSAVPRESDGLKDRTYRKTSRGNDSASSELDGEELQRFGKALKESLDRSLFSLHQQLSVAPYEVEEKRQMSKMLMDMDAEAKKCYLN